LFGGDFYLSAAPEVGIPACSLVFVQSKDGNTGADDPFVLGGGETDKHVIYEGLSQVAADAVLSGANTIRDSEMLFAVWHPEIVQLRSTLGKPRFPIQVVATRHGVDLESCLLFNVPEVPACVLTVAAGLEHMQDALALRPWVRSIVMDDPSDLRAAFDALHDLGIRRVSAVGGRQTATQLIDAGLVQDVYLTTSAKEAGEPGTPMYAGMLRARTLVRKHGTKRDSGVHFEHLHLEYVPTSLEASRRTT
jgi:riboflavin biosynthesis pyrimidine reductase